MTRVRALLLSFLVLSFMPWLYAKLISKEFVSAELVVELSSLLDKTQKNLKFSEQRLKVVKQLDSDAAKILKQHRLNNKPLQLRGKSFSSDNLFQHQIILIGQELHQQEQQWQQFKNNETRLIQQIGAVCWKLNPEPDICQRISLSPGTQ